MTEKITLTRDPQKLERDLQRYVQMAIANGATDAKIISTQSIVLDERVRMKCQFPLCDNYGACLNCPPHTGTVDETRAKIKLYEHALVFKVNFPSDQIVPSADPKVNNEGRRLIGRIISTLEGAMFYDGYYLAAGFGGGSCRVVWCSGQSCQAVKGEGCRFQARARASMEAVGMDVYRLSTSLGWDIYPIGKSSTAESVPHGTRLGLILIT